jgi:hypothetical protein
MPIGYINAPLDDVDERKHRRALATTLRGAMRGKINAGLQVTLTPSATTSIIEDARITLQSAILMSPLTAHGAADMNSMWFQPVNGSVVINHASNTNADRTFNMVIIG